MDIPEPPANIPKAVREWLKLLAVALGTGAAFAGSFCRTTPHKGKGTVINFASSSERRGEGIPGSSGACCYDSGGCAQLTAMGCTASGGHYQGDGTVCSGVNCSGGGTGTTGACCEVDGDCSVTFPSTCFGTYQGDGTSCTPGLCDDPSEEGACCDDLGNCTSTPSGGCSGIFHGGGTDCGSIDCNAVEPTGACCDTPTTICHITTFGGCAGIFYEGVGCESVGSCAGAFCGPTFYWCACEERGGYTPSPTCCENVNPICLTCYNVVGGLYYCCCCHDNPPFGLVCT